MERKSASLSACDLYNISVKFGVGFLHIRLRNPLELSENQLNDTSSLLKGVKDFMMLHIS